MAPSLAATPRGVSVFRHRLAQRTSSVKIPDVRLVSPSSKLATNAEDGAVTASVLLLDFLRDQGLAAALGFRRAWPSTRQSGYHKIAAGSDLKFARALHDLGLLLPSLDAESPQEPPAQAWDIWETKMQPLPFATSK